MMKLQDNGVIRLCAAVIKQARQDYRKAKTENDYFEIRQIENFLRHGFIGNVIDPDVAIEEFKRGL